MKKKILFIYPEMMMGGSTTSFINLLTELNYDEYEVDVAFRKKRGALCNYLPKEVNILRQLDEFPDNIIGKLLKIFLLLLNKNFYKYIYYKIKKNSKKCNQISAYYQVVFCRNIKQKYDVAISFLEGFANAYLNSKKVVATKKINWIHIDYKKAGFDIKYDLKCLSKANNIVFVSKNCMENFKTIAPSLSSKLRVVENVISQKLILQKSQEYSIDNNEIKFGKMIKFLTVCRLDTHTKGLDRIINIVKKLKEKKYNFCWYIIGGNANTEFEKIYSNFEYKDNLILLGEKINPFPYYQFFDAFVLASRFEGKPMVVTEALLLNLPVIVTKYSSSCEQIVHNHNGIIVENSEEALYVQIENLLKDSKILQELKENLKNDKYNAQEYLSTFYNLLEN